MQNTGDDLQGLLGTLTNEELRQYGQMALDQAGRSDRWFLGRLAGLVVGFGFACWGIFSGLTGGFRFATFYWLAPGLIAGYWHYRCLKSRQMWSGHFGVVNDELARRGEGLMETGSNSQ